MYVKVGTKCLFKNVATGPFVSQNIVAKHLKQTPYLPEKFKPEINLNYVKTFSSYRTVNTLHLHYKDSCIR